MAALAKCLLPILLVVPTLAAGQAQPQPDLTHFTQAQLVACYDNLKLCGAQDIYAIEDDLKRRLPTLPASELVRCFSDWHICGVGEGTASGWPISDELRRRGHLTQFLAQYGSTTNPDIRDGLEHLAYNSHSPAARSYLNRNFNKHLDDGEDLYWPAKYLAKECVPAALQYLSNTSHRFGISSYELSTSVVFFGRCHYRPAIPFILTYALDAASLNLVDSAVSSLRVFYPNAPKFSSLEEEQHWFCRAAHRDGYKADCDEGDPSSPKQKPLP
jgi:hypothetical protein